MYGLLWKQESELKIPVPPKEDQNFGDLLPFKATRNSFSGFSLARSIFTQVNLSKMILLKLQAHEFFFMQNSNLHVEPNIVNNSYSLPILMTSVEIKHRPSQNKYVLKCQTVQLK